MIIQTHTANVEHRIELFNIRLACMPRPNLFYFVSLWVVLANEPPVHILLASSWSQKLINRACVGLIERKLKSNPYHWIWTVHQHHQQSCRNEIAQSKVKQTQVDQEREAEWLLIRYILNLQVSLAVVNSSSILGWFRNSGGCNFVWEARKQTTKSFLLVRTNHGCLRREAIS